MSNEVIVRTQDQDLEFIKKVIRQMRHERLTSIKEPYHELRSEEIYKSFDGLKYNTLRDWCRKGIIGKKGLDGKYYVTLSEIENKLFNQ